MEVIEVPDLVYVRKWGGSATDAILDPTCKSFRIPDVDGLLGYREESGCAVVFGDPVCPPNQVASLIKAFEEYCAKQNLITIYLIVSEEFARWLIRNGYSKIMIEYGEELFLDPHNDPRKKEGVRASLVRRKVRHALHDGVVVKEYIPFDEQIEKGIIEVGDEWLNGRKGPQIHVSHVRSFDNREGKRWFYAEKKGKIEGVVIISRLEKYQGWLLNHVMFTPKASHGVPELLIVSALEKLAQEECRYVTFGTVPADQLGEIVGLNTLNTYIARGVYSLANMTYHLNGKKKFWGKFDPQSKKAFIMFKNSYIGLKEALGLKKSLNATVISK